MTVTVNIGNSVSAPTTSNLLDAEKIISGLEESTDEKVSGTALDVLRQISMKINLTLKNQDLILQNQHKLLIEV
ncbi:MAG: hypothetical protein AABZ92_04505, partial [Verrucomicrobiota bacterium]